VNRLLMQSTGYATGEATYLSVATESVTEQMKVAMKRSSHAIKGTKTKLRPKRVSDMLRNP